MTGDPSLRPIGRVDCALASPALWHPRRRSTWTPALQRAARTDYRRKTRRRNRRRHR